MKFLYIFIFSLSYFISFSQVKILGTVKRLENSEFLVGATVSIKGTTRGTMVNLDGSYQLTSPKNNGDIIVVARFIGFKDVEKTVTLSELNKVVNFEMISNDLQLTDVVVTARKVEEFLQKTPIAASVVSSSEIERRSAYSTLETLNSIPNMLTDSWVSSQPTFSIRGLASNFESVGFESTVSLYIDDVFYSRGFGFNSTLFDIKRVEVLRGPQGTLFGKNTVGGVIHVVSETPEFATNGQIEANYGNYNFFQLRGKFNTELIKNKLTLRITGSTTRRNGYINELEKDLNKNNKTDFKGFRGSVLYKPTTNLEIVGRFYYGKDNSAENSFVYGENRNFNAVNIKTDTYESVNDNDAQLFNRNQYGTSLKAEYKLNDYTITSVSGYANASDNYFGDNDRTPLNIATWGHGQILNNFSQELRIASPRTQKYNYVGGVYFLRETITGTDELSLYKDILPISDKLFNEVYPNVSDYKESSLTKAVVHSSSKAAFLAGNYFIKPKLFLSGGIRFTNENKDLTYFQTLNYQKFQNKKIGVIDNLLVPLGSEKEPIKDKTIDNEFSGDVGLNFQASTFTLLYSKISRGFKGSGFNTSPSEYVDRNSYAFKPEYMYNYELGFKNKFSDRIKLNGALFFIDYFNKQELLNVGYDAHVGNAKRANGWGAEVEFSGIFDKLKIDASAGTVNLKYKDFVLVGGEVGELVIFAKGNYLFKSPRVTASISPEYSLSVVEKYKIVIGVNANHVGKTFNDIDNQEEFARQPTTIINGRAAFMPKNGKWSIALWGKNITNERYIQHAFFYKWGNQISWSRPRYVGLEMYLNFF